MQKQKNHIIDFAIHFVWWVILIWKGNAVAYWIYQGLIARHKVRVAVLNKNHQGCDSVLAGLPSRIHFLFGFRLKDIFPFLLLTLKSNRKDISLLGWSCRSNRNKSGRNFFSAKFKTNLAFTSNIKENQSISEYLFMFFPMKLHTIHYLPFSSTFKKEAPSPPPLIKNDPNCAIDVWWSDHGPFLGPFRKSFQIHR